MNRLKNSLSLLISLVLVAGILQGASPAATSGDVHRAFFQNLERLKNTAAAGHSAILAKAPFQTQASAASGSITGRMTGLDSSAIGNAAVYAWPADPVSNVITKGFALVDSNFTYHIDSLEAGNYIVMAWAEGCYSIYFDNVIRLELATPVTVDEGQVREHIDFTMIRPTPGTGSISGEVTDDKTRNPIANATVYVSASSDPYYYGKAQTDERGHFVVGELKSGIYAADAYAEGYIAQTYYNPAIENPFSIEVIEPQETANIDFALSRASSINGTITTRDGYPLASIYVEAYPVKNDTIMSPPLMPQYGISDDAGHYSIQSMEPGRYYVRADFYDSWYGFSIWYHNASSPDSATIIDLQPEQDLFNIDFQVRYANPDGSISGRVTDGSGSPVANASIQVQNSPFADPGAIKWYYGSVATDANGYYRIDNLPEGQYLVSVWMQNGWESIQRYWPDAETPEAARIIPIDEANSSWVLDFILPIKQGLSSISGTVRALDGQALAGAFVQLSPGQVTGSDGATRSAVWAYAYTDSSGFYAIKGLPEGTYIVYCSHWQDQGFGQQWYLDADSARLATPVVLTENEQRGDIDFILNIHPIYGSIVGAISDGATALPIARAYVQIKPIWRDSDSFFAPWFWYPSYAITDESGQYHVDGLREGDYLVSVYANGAFAFYPSAQVAEQAETIKIVGGQKSPADFKLTLRNDGPGSISGLVGVDYSTMPAVVIGPDSAISPTPETVPEIAVVMARPAITILMWPQSEAFYTAVTDQEGYYLLSGLPSGEYYVSCFAPGNLLQYYDGVYDPAEARLVAVNGAEKIKDIDFALKPQLYRYMDGPNKGGAVANGVMGQVLDESNQPVADAVVYLLDESGTPVSFTTTDENGNYQLSGLPAGNYLLQAGKVGYETTYNGNTREKSDAQKFSLINNVIVIDLTMGPQKNSGVNPAPVADEFKLFGNFPNPFNPETAIQFSLPGESRLVLRIFNTLGQEVRTLFDGFLGAGYHELKWDGRDDHGASVVSGLYFYRFESASFTKTGKMLYLR